MNALIYYHGKHILTILPHVAAFKINIAVVAVACVIAVFVGGKMGGGGGGGSGIHGDGWGGQRRNPWK